MAMLMSLASGETEKAAARRELEDTELLDELFIAPMREEWDLVGVGWEDVDVGDMARYASALLTKFFPDETRVIDILVFMQEEGPQAAVVQVTSTWLAGETPVVDTITIAEEISNNIANR